MKSEARRTKDEESPKPDGKGAWVPDQGPNDSGFGIRVSSRRAAAPSLPAGFRHSSFGFQ